jgi:hypothetical protein
MVKSSLIFYLRTVTYLKTSQSPRGYSGSCYPSFRGEHSAGSLGEENFAPHGVAMMYIPLANKPLTSPRMAGVARVTILKAPIRLDP